MLLVPGGMPLQDVKLNVIKRTILQTCLDQNRKTAYDLIASHGDVENLIFFAMLMQGVYL